MTQLHNTSAAQRVQGVIFVIDVAKTAGLKSMEHGDITALANTTSCSRSFAKSVLVAIEAGLEADFLTRNMRYDAM